MMNYSFCEHFHNFCDPRFPCLYDPSTRASLVLKVALVMLHVIYIGVLFLLDGYLIEKFRKEPWYTGLYLCLFAATLAQYFFTSGSSPGYVLDAMRAVIEADPSFVPSSKNGQLIVHMVNGVNMGRNYKEGSPTAWTKLVMDMYPSELAARTLTCTYCNILQPPRAKHCHDCDRCVLQFDHHCVWLGTCIGQGNHCRFWWYICEETALCLWTCILYILYLTTNTSRVWWIYTIMIVLLATLLISLIFLLLLLIFHGYLVLTNQTTYELVRRRRIHYLRPIPERVYPFSKGICRNLYNFCCGGRGIHTLEPLPTAEEVEAKSKPYTCLDVLSCRCC